MAWSIFQQGGGDGAALTWAKNLIAADGIPDTPAVEQFVYDWEKSEGGGGKYNPLNQGPVPGHPELTTTGEQYGGGAADFASYQAGIQGAVDYLNMPNYAAVQSALKNGDAVSARAALIRSPWAASHYDYGAAFSSAPTPGQTSNLLGDPSTGVAAGTGNVQPAANAATAGFSLSSLVPDLFSGWLSGLFGLPVSDLSPTDLLNGFKNLLVRGALVVFGGVILIVGVIKFSGTDQKVTTIVSGVVGATPEGQVAKTGAKAKQEEKESASDDEGEKDKESDGGGVRKGEG
jgi:hypothetical protein